MIVLTIVLVSCSKDGAMGPQGDKGEVGTPGTDGKTILSGASDPTESTGKSGDFYINANNYLLFGPKTASGWGSGTSILGTTGDKGDQGVKGDKGEADYVILSGSRDPLDNIGKLGDFYYNSRTKTLFYRTGTLKGNRWGQVVKFANTIQFTKIIDMTTGILYYTIDFDLPYEVFKRSMINVYLELNESNYWTPVPGKLPVGDGSVDYIHYEPHLDNEDYMRLVILFNDVPESTYVGELRIVVTEADVFKVISKKVDFKNYTEVNRYSQLGQ
jgi:hypothetical protein